MMNKPIKPIENHYLVQVELDNGESYTITSPVYRLLRDKYYDDLEKYCNILEQKIDEIKGTCYYGSYDDRDIDKQVILDIIEE